MAKEVPKTKTLGTLRVVRVLESVNSIWLVLTGGAMGLLLFATGPLSIASLRGLEARIAIAFPPGSSLVEAKLNPRWSGQVVGILLVPHDALDSLFGAPPFCGYVSRTESSLQTIRRRRVPLQSWRPEATRDFIAAEAIYHDKSYAISILAALDDSALATVYLAWDLL